jgi:uncharacterized RDD family membrane protein YckC
MTDQFSSDWDNPATPASSSIASEEKASFGIRFLGHICDNIMMVVVTFPFVILSSAVSGTASTASQAAQFLVSFAFLAHWIGTQGGSPLRRKLGVYILDEKDGSYIGTQRAAVRIIMSWVSGLVLLLGYLSMLWNPQRQTWHDRVAKSVVVRR